MRKHWTNPPFSAPCAALFASLVLVGCGSKQSELSGTVTYQGKPLSSGSVLVAGSDGMVKASPIQPDGAYKIKGIVTGTIRVTVSSPDPGIAAAPSRNMQAPAPPTKDNSKWFPIPDDYSDFNKSGLTFDLKRGANRWDIELNTK